MGAFPREYTVLILDLGDVLFSWSPLTNTAIPPRQLKSILSSPTWHDYERGRLTQSECYRAVAMQFSLQVDDIAEAFQQARESLAVNDELLHVVRTLKSEANGRLRVFALSNISAPDYAYIRTLPVDWSIFDGVFASALVGARKPDLEVYQRVIEAANINPGQALLVDDKVENVLAARAAGLGGIVFSKQSDVIITLRSIYGQPAERGRAFLASRAGELWSETDTQVTFGENFTQLLILELMNDSSLVHLSNLERPNRTWNFFQGVPLFSEKFPDDLDTTALAMLHVMNDRSVVQAIMDKMLANTTADGVFLTYFDATRPRLDPVVNFNVIVLFYMFGRAREVQRSLDWVCSFLERGRHLEGTRYYPSPDAILFFASRLLERSADEQLHARLVPLVTRHLRERVGIMGDPMELAMRVLVCRQFGVANEVDLTRLIEMQCRDGGWEVGWLYRFGSSGIKAGSRGLTTALAIKAIEAAQHVVVNNKLQAPPTPPTEGLDIPVERL